jgi:hypothetical protein
MKSLRKDSKQTARAWPRVTMRLDENGHTHKYAFIHPLHARVMPKLVEIVKLA